MKKRNLLLLVTICVPIALLLQSGQSGGVKNLSVFGSGNYYSADKAFSSIKVNSSMSTGTMFLAFVATRVAARVACPTAPQVVAATQDVFVTAPQVAATAAELAEAAVAAVTVTVAAYNDDIWRNNIAMNDLD
ncbi:MAG: hypothetical protein ACQPRH_05890 [Solitalea-like symbiont of Tyrophagus putrescentiae]